MPYLNSIKRVRILAFLCLAVSPTFEAHARDTAGNTTVSPEVSAKVSSTWDLELKGDREQELKLAQELANGSSPDWAGAWANGVVYRLTSLGKPIEMAFTATDGREIDLRSMKGHVVLVDFWATWCAPCIDALPKLKVTYLRYHSQGLEIVGVSWDNDRAKLASFIGERQVAWPQYCDGRKPGKWGEAFGIGGVPYVMLVDKLGCLRFFGANCDSTALEEQISRLLAE